MNLHVTPFLLLSTEILGDYMNGTSITMIRFRALEICGLDTKFVFFDYFFLSHP